MPGGLLQVGGFRRSPDHAGGDGQRQPPARRTEPALPKESLEQSPRLLVEGLGSTLIRGVTGLGTARAQVLADGWVPRVRESLLAPPVEKTAGLELIDHVQRPVAWVGAEAPQDVTLLWGSGAPDPSNEGQ